MLDGKSGYTVDAALLGWLTYGWLDYVLYLFDTP
jgi:hypothetical protein